MATHDYILANASGAAFRTDLNNALAAIVSNNSNSSSPATTYAYQWWADTSAGVLKIRNSANNAWIELLQLDGTLTLEDGSAANPAIAFRDDLNTGIFSAGADQINISTGGTQRLAIDGTGKVGIKATSMAAQLCVDTDALGTTANNTQELFQVFSPDVSNTTVYRFTNIRNTDGSSHSSSELQFRRIVDATVMGHIALADGCVKLGYNNSEKARLTSTGAFLVARTSAHSDGTFGEAKFQISGVSGSHIAMVSEFDTTNSITHVLFRNPNGNIGAIGTHNSDLLLFTANSERMRITSDGRVSFSISSPPAGGAGVISFAGFTSRNGSTGTNATNVMNFHWTGSSLDAYVDTVNQGEIRNSASDYRIKRNIQTQTESGIEKVKQIRCVTYSPADFKSEGGTTLSVATDQVKEGFIAHEVAAIIPSGVSGEKDDPNRIQQLNLDAILSVTTKALQEAIVKIESLETKVAALESA